MFGVIEEKKISCVAEEKGKTMDKNEEAKLINRAFETGFNYEKTYRGCAQCTLATFFDISGHTDPALFKAASGLSAGIGINGDGSCGGYTGGVLFMSSLVGRRLDRIPIDRDRAAQLKSYEMAQKLHDKFIETYGSVTCADIHKRIFGKSYCLREPGVLEAFEEAGAHVDKCTTVVGNACSWVAKILIDEGLLNIEE